MKSHSITRELKAILFAMTFLMAATAHAEWIRNDTSIAWQRDGHVLWQFTYDPAKGKPFFHPLSPGSQSLTNFKPEDHPWHYGLWFSWKYINGANYWEEDKKSGRAEGATRWSDVRVDPRADGSAQIQMNLTYTHPSGRVDLTETRVLQVSAPDPQGDFSIDWSATFVAGDEGVEFGRTAMPGEPNGQVNGGYAGLSARLASKPAQMTVVTPQGIVDNYASDRARPNALAIGANFTQAGRSIGSLGIFNDPGNISERAPWYVVNSADQMRFICAAVLAPAVRKLPPHGQWKLRYRVAVQSTPWTSQSLEAAALDWNRASIMHSAAIDWNEVPAKKSDVRIVRQFFQAPTATLDELELHVTTLAAGEASHPPHQHPNEELVIIKEGTVEVLVRGEWKRVGPGSVIFNASNELHALRNVGDGPATYHVINWHSAPRLTPSAQ
jgi:quercetin dioxygenase-like cupin family protein